MNVKKTKKIVVLTTGGTIAGVAKDPSKPQEYSAGQLSGADLLNGLTIKNSEIQIEQITQIDSKDMTFAVWQNLLARSTYWLAQDDVQGIVITHGTDTLEETAYFLYALLHPTKAVAITCAMRPSNAPDADGPGNLKDALSWVSADASSGVSVICSGQVHDGNSVQKIHSHQLNPFFSQSQVSHPAALKVPSVEQVLACKRWPRVEMVLNHVQADGRLVRALMTHDKPDGWVCAGTGNGTLHSDLELALSEAQAQGVSVVRASRCLQGGVESRETDVFPHAGALSPVQARVALLLDLIATQANKMTSNENRS